MYRLSRLQSKALSFTTKPVRNYSTKLSNESFLDGSSGDYVESQYLAWKKDPSSVHSSWASFFKNVDAGKGVGSAFTPPPTLFPSPPIQRTEATNSFQDNLKVVDLINAYRSLGHRHAKLDPLNISPLPNVPELEPKYYGLSEADLSKEYYFSDTTTYPFSGKKLTDILAHLKEVYCGSIGVEYSHINVRFVFSILYKNMILG
jgi:2-oxoglutarate dehydrogenase E1 component